jgi:hypothetical protein
MQFSFSTPKMQAGMHLLLICPLLNNVAIMIAICYRPFSLDDGYERQDMEGSRYDLFQDRHSDIHTKRPRKVTKNLRRETNFKSGLKFAAPQIQTRSVALEINYFL